MNAIGYIFCTALFILVLFFIQTIRRRSRQLAVFLLAGDEAKMTEDKLSIWAMSFGTTKVMGLDPKRAVRMRGRMALSKTRFVLVTEQGRFADVRVDEGRKLTSARCTAPGRLVIEGTIPQVGRQPGVYRLEVLFDRAADWAVALQPFVDPDAPKFGVMPPVMQPPKSS
jgi:hypothetical protein